MGVRSLAVTAPLFPGPTISKRYTTLVDVTNNREAYTFTWDMIAANFATKILQTGQDWVNFRTEIKKAILELTTAWPNAGITADTNGVTVTRTSPSVQQKPPRPELD